MLETIGNTPLVRLRRIPPSNSAEIWLKIEGVNPTGSYKDRFATLAVTRMKMDGMSRCVGTSSGNAGSAIAAYCARAKIGYEVATVETAPIGKLQQMISYGATVIRVKGFGINPDTNRRLMD